MPPGRIDAGFRQYVQIDPLSGHFPGDFIHSGPG
jgi:hypothetical protein